MQIPANFLSYSILTGFFILECTGRVNEKNEIEQAPITIDPNAFKSSSNSLQNLVIYNCDLSRLDFSFLTGFDQLLGLGIVNPTSIFNLTLPPLPSLLKLAIIVWNENWNWNEWTQILHPLTNGLHEFTFIAGVDDEAANRLVQWLLNSSATTLQRLELLQTKITKIPQGISNFENLFDRLIITCNESEIKVLAENSINFFNGLPEEIQITRCGIGELQPGAIQGN